MATKKMEGRIEVIEEQMIGVHGEMMSIKGNLQRLGPLEVKLEKLSMLERMEKMLQKWENLKKGSYPEGNPMGLSYCHSWRGSLTKSL